MVVDVNLFSQLTGAVGLLTHFAALFALLLVLRSLVPRRGKMSLLKWPQAGGLHIIV